MLNAVTKVIYAIIRAKFGIEQGIKPKKPNANKTGVLKAKKRQDSSDEESDFGESQNYYTSQDSECIINKV